MSQVVSASVRTSDLPHFLSGSGYGLIYPENQIWLFAKSLKILSGQPYGIKKNSAIFYPDRDLATKGAFRGPNILHSTRATSSTSSTDVKYQLTP